MILKCSTWCSRTLGAVCGLAMTAAALGLIVLVPSPVTAQQYAASGPIVLPKGPAKPGFDISRFIPAGGVFETFHVTQTQSVRSALEAGLVSNDTGLLVTETGRGMLALLVEQMAFHHIAQGRTGGQDWLISFCVVCNTGTRLVPTVSGKPARFNPAGAYDALLVMQDAETGTLWNHITGEAVYGPRVGSNLGPIGNVLQMNVKQALAMDREVRIAISDRFYFAGGRIHGTTSGFWIGSLQGAAALTALARQASVQSTNTAPDPRRALSDVLAETLGEEDTRRPRMELGLGIWTGSSSRYYPIELIRKNGSALIDEVQGRRVLVYIDPDTFIPAALYVNSTRARLDGGTVRLDGGQVVRSGVLWDARGARLTSERPQQVFTRWYGFALTFPGTEIFGQE